MRGCVLDFVRITSGLNSKAPVVWLYNNPVLSNAPLNWFRRTDFSEVLVIFPTSLLVNVQEV